MKRSSSIRRKTPLDLARKPVRRRNPERQAAEFARTYHSEARVLWVKAQPCELCMLEGGRDQTTPTENAHAGGNDGMSRKGPYIEILPACRWHHDRLDGRALPPLPARILSKLPTLTQYTQRRWLAYQRLHHAPL